MIVSGELKQANEQLQEDISERKQAEEKLRYSGHLLERTLYSVRDAVFILDADTFEIIECNHAALPIPFLINQEVCENEKLSV